MANKTKKAKTTEKINSKTAHVMRLICAAVCAAVFVTMFAGCSLFVNGGDFVLMADRYSVQPTGSDYPTLFYYTKDGEEITGTVSVYADGVRVKRGRVTLDSEKTVAVYAEYRGMRSNTIFIKGEYSSDLPVIVIDVGDKIVNQTVAVDGKFYLYDTGASGRTLYGKGRSASVTSDCTVKIRGQSSAQIYAKKQYKIHLENSDGTNNNVSLLGMPSENDWIINGTYGDKTVLHNYLAYSLAASMDFEWTPRIRFCEVYITSDKDDMKDEEYLGLYVLIESIKVDSDRVDITEGGRDTSPESVGYLFAKDKQEKLTSQNMIDTGYGRYELSYPQPEDITAAQKTYLKNCIRRFEDALYGENFTDPEMGYRAYLDVDSYIDGVLLTELMKNVDGMRLSTFFTLDTDGIIKYGPVWDYDISCGTCNYGMGLQLSTGFVCIDSSKRYVDDYAWLDRLMEDPWFRNRMSERYYELRGTVFSEENIQGIIDGAYLTVLEAATRNGKRWPELYDGHSEIWPNAYKYRSYTQAVNHLKTWLHERVEWLDDNMKGII